MLAAQELLRLCAQHPEAEAREKATAAAEAARESAAAAAGGRTGAAAAAGGGGAAGEGSDAAAAPVAAAPAEPDSTGAHVAGKFVHQSVAVIGLALVSMGEELSVDSEWPTTVTYPHVDDSMIASMQRSPLVDPLLTFPLHCQ